MIEIIRFDTKPLTFMGQCASYCWGSKPSAQIGIDCIDSGHGRVLEYPDVTIGISGYSARVIREIYTHIIGTTRLQASTRYIQYGEFDYITPPTIARNTLALAKYQKLMFAIQETYRELEDLGIPKEDIGMTLPLAMESKIVLKINARAILHMAETRECRRAYWEFRNFMKELHKVLGALDKEWDKIMTYAKPICEVYGRCTEKNPCEKGKKLQEKSKEVIL